MLKDKASNLKIELKNKVQLINNIHFLSAEIDLDQSAIKDLAFQLGGDIDNLSFISGSNIDNKPMLTVYISKNLVNEELNAGKIVRELGKFLLDGTLYQGYKPVLWSTVEKTALADAEVEYQDHKSDTIYTSFPVKSSNIKELEGSEIIIWTTTSCWLGITAGMSW